MSKHNRERRVVKAIAKGKLAKHGGINPYRKNPYKQAWEQGKR